MSVSRRVALAALGVGAVAAGAAGVGYEIATGEKPEPPPPPLVDKDGHLVWRNWSGLRYSYPTERAAPSTEDELLGCKNFGQTSLNEIKQQLATFGMGLRKLEE